MFPFIDKFLIYPNIGEQSCSKSMIMNRIADIFPTSPIAISPITHNTTEYVIISDISTTMSTTTKFYCIELFRNKFTLIRSLLLTGAIGKSAQLVHIRGCLTPRKGQPRSVRYCTPPPR